MLLSGVYTAKKKNGDTLYRSSITHKGKHISLGSFPSEETANNAYLEAIRLLRKDPVPALSDYAPGNRLPSF